MPDISPSLFWTGVVLGLVALFTSFFRNIPAHLFGQLRRLFIVRVEILNSDNLFEWLKVWFDKDQHSKKSRLVTASAIPISDASAAGHESKKWRILFTPSPGFHTIFFKGRPVLINRERKDIAGSGGAVVGVRDVFILYFFTRRQDLVREFLKEAEIVANEERVNKLTVFSADQFQNWSVLSIREKRPLDSVILVEGVKEMVVEDIALFLGSEKWYKEMAIPFHRGYLFYGPPGSGKSSLAIALASELNLDMYLLNLGNLTDTRLTTLLANVSPHSIVLLEDIDSAFTNRTGTSKITFSGFLNALDGVYAKDGVIIFMSTNHLDRLDPALLRPGRIDCKVFLGHSDHHQQEQAFNRFFPGHEAEAKLFSESLCHEEISMASLQEYLLSRRGDRVRAMEEVGMLLLGNSMVEQEAVKHHTTKDN